MRDYASLAVAMFAIAIIALIVAILAANGAFSR